MKVRLALLALAPTVACSGSDGALSIATTTLDRAVAGEAYSTGINGLGGSGPYQWTLLEAPSGLALGPGRERSVTLAGTPDAAGSFEITVRLEDAKSRAVERTLDLEVVEPLRITTVELPAGVSDAPYSATIEAIGGTGRDRVWTVVDGALPAGLALDRGGLPATTIAGTPAAGTDGVHRFTIAVEDSGFVYGERAFELEIANGGLRFVTTSLPRASVFAPYDETIEATGGDAPYTWRLPGSAPPPGIEFLGSATPTAQLIGAPTSVGRFDFEVEIEDATGATVTQVFAIDVARSMAVVIATDQLPTAIRGETYAATIETRGGTVGDFEWSVTDALPPGLTLPTTGAPNVELGGTPTATGRYDFTITVTDGAGSSDAQAFTLEVVEPLTIVGAPEISLPDAPGGEDYVATVTAAGGAGVLTWGLTAGTLPDGFAFAHDGFNVARITGRARALGTFAVEVTVSDELGQSATADVEITVGPPSTMPTIVTSSVPPGVVCDGYHERIEATGGARLGYTWTVVSGTLPPGLRLAPSGDPTTRLDGGLSDQTGSYTFTVRVADHFGQTDDATFTIDVVDGLGGFRWIASSGDNVVLSQDRIHLTRVCGAPSPPIDVSPPNAHADGDTSREPHGAAFSPDGRAFAYLGDLTVDERQDVYVVSLVTGTPGPAIRVTGALPFTATKGAEDLRWSPDGSMLAFSADATTDGALEVFVVDVGDPLVPGPPMRVSQIWTDAVDTVERAAYDFAPDSSQIAYVVSRDFEDHPWVVDISAVPSGGPPGPPRDVHPNPPVGGRCLHDFLWTDDSRALIYTAEFGDPFAFEPWWTDVSAPVPGPPIPLGRLGGQVPSTHCQPPKVAPDGSMVVFSCPEAPHLGFRAFVVDLTGALPSAPTRLLDVPATDYIVWNYTWSPDSTKLLILSTHRVLGRTEGYVVDMTGTFPVVPDHLAHPGYGPSRMLTLSDDYEFQWSPDGRWVSVQGDLDVDEQDGTYVADVGAGPPYQLVRVHPSFPASDDFTYDAQFSWDSRYLAVLARWDSPHGLYVVDLEQLGTWDALHPALHWVYIVGSYGWDSFWRYQWTPNNDVVFTSSPRLEADELRSTHVSGSPPYVPRRIGPAGSVVGTDTKFLWGQGYYARRHSDQLRYPLF